MSDFFKNIDNRIADIEEQLEKAKLELKFWESSLKNRKSHQYQMSRVLVKSLQDQLNHLVNEKDC